MFVRAALVARAPVGRRLLSSAAQPAEPAMPLKTFKYILGGSYAAIALYGLVAPAPAEHTEPAKVEENPEVVADSGETSPAQPRTSEPATSTSTVTVSKPKSPFRGYYGGDVAATSPAQDEAFMARAVELAKKAWDAGGYPFGALIVDSRTGEVVAEGGNDANCT